MRTNIDRAINELLLSNKDITLANALPAYLQEAGFSKLSPDALIAFEHALDKYPTRTDHSRAAFLRGISDITAEYFLNKYEALVEIPCCHCAAYACQMPDLKSGSKARSHWHGHTEDERKREGLRCLKSKKKRRRVRVKEDAPVYFDPFAPSTSAIM